jgi:hypothetical protein
MAARHAPRAPSVRFPVQPRLVPADKAARRLHVTPAEFDAKLPELLRLGFPAPCPVLGNFDLVAIDAWCDRVAGLVGAAPAPAAEREAVMRERIARIG